MVAPLVALAALVPMPVRGLHMLAPGPADVDRTAKFIREVLPKEGVNTLVLQIDYSFKFQKHPEVAERNAISRDDVKKLVAACRQAKVRLIPELDCLGHQSYSNVTAGLLRSHPEFDETPGKYKDNVGIYSRSYCPLHPQLHEVLFDLIDEVAEAFECDAFHIGMDEVFILGDPDCPRCKNVPHAELVAGEIKRLYDHLKAKNLEMWMWGDRLVDGRVNGLGDWQATGNDTQDALRSTPKDVVICSWNYELAEPTALYFALMGYRCVASWAGKLNVAQGHLDLLDLVRQNANPTIRDHLYGFLHTVWHDSGTFIDAYYGKKTAPPAALESAKTFKAMFKRIRKETP